MSSYQAHCQVTDSFQLVIGVGVYFVQIIQLYCYFNILSTTAGVFYCSDNILNSYSREYTFEHSYCLGLGESAIIS